MSNPEPRREPEPRPDDEEESLECDERNLDFNDDCDEHDDNNLIMTTYQESVFSLQ